MEFPGVCRAGMVARALLESTEAIFPLHFSAGTWKNYYDCILRGIIG